jgi:hypothetical protein
MMLTFSLFREPAVSDPASLHSSARRAWQPRVGQSAVSVEGLRPYIFDALWLPSRWPPGPTSSSNVGVQQGFRFKTTNEADPPDSSLTAWPSAAAWGLSLPSASPHVMQPASAPRQWPGVDQPTARSGLVIINKPTPRLCILAQGT